MHSRLVLTGVHRSLRQARMLLTPASQICGSAGSAASSKQPSSSVAQLAGRLLQPDLHSSAARPVLRPCQASRQQTGQQQRLYAAQTLVREDVTEEFLRHSDDEDDEELEVGDLSQGAKSLASIFESDDELIEVDAEQTDESLLLANCGLSPETVRALNERGILSLFPIQKHVYDPAASGRDLIGRAKTGSGKTLAFALPVIEGLLRGNQENPPRRGRAPRCLIMAPTRELAKQVEREFQQAAPGLKTGCYYGGSDIGAQIRDLRAGTDVAVGTPGRVIDLVERRLLLLNEIQYVVLDEADMMLNVGFADDVEHILSGVPEQRQTMLFSATMPSWVKGLTQKYLKTPVLVDLVGDSASGKINESVSVMGVQVSHHQRRSVLVDLLTVYGAGGKAIVFCDRKRDADEISAAVALSIPCESLHGDMSQGAREAVLKRFRDGRLLVLVATDVAARGLDIANVELVVHYELPKDHESFLHRSGRTGRAGKTGTAIAMFTPAETRSFRQIVRQFKVPNLQIIGPPGPSQVMAASAKQVMRRLDNIDPEVKSFFQPAAQAVLANADPQSAMSAALAALSGIMEVPKERSLLGQQLGMTTLRVTSKPGRLTRPEHVFVIVRNLVDAQAANSVGSVRMLPPDESGNQGAAFDVPSAIADKIVAGQAELTSRGFDLDRPNSLPLEEDRGGSGGGGGGFSRGGNRSGYGSGGRSNYGSRGGSNSYGGRSGGGGGYSNSRGNSSGRSSGWGDRGAGRRSYSDNSYGSNYY